MSAHTLRASIWKIIDSIVPQGAKARDSPNVVRSRNVGFFMVMLLLLQERSSGTWECKAMSVFPAVRFFNTSIPGLEIAGSHIKPYSSLISHTIMPQVSGTAFTQAPTHRLHRSKGSPRPPKSLADSPVSFPPSLDCSVSSQGFHKAHRSHRAYLWSTSMPDTRLLAYSPTHRRPSGKGDRIKATET